MRLLKWITNICIFEPPGYSDSFCQPDLVIPGFLQISSTASRLVDNEAFVFWILSKTLGKPEQQQSWVILREIEPLVYEIAAFLNFWTCWVERIGCRWVLMIPGFLQVSSKATRSEDNDDLSFWTCCAERVCWRWDLMMLGFLQISSKAARLGDNDVLNLRDLFGVNF